MKNKTNLLLVIACITSLAVISCRSMMDRVTPTTVTEQSYEYVEGSLDGFKEIDSLHNVKKLRTKIIIKHRTEQIGYLRAAEDDDHANSDAIGFINANIKEAEYLQGIIVGSEDQPLSLIGILAGFTGGAAIGRALKRKGDYSPEEVEAVVAKAKRRVD
ncbi:hypothetical protein LCGC14_0437140 [marine sediment metagenome]|uniref:Uncharacterized protein n=1 Tax=marine sediment metagenome TaxID=412755 RepID=A0A0F9VVM9_9ZZZZ